MRESEKVCIVNDSDPYGPNLSIFRTRLMALSGIFWAVSLF